ncbi:MAG: hypothetical protein V7776_22975 [Halopseudomonas aestusnigri]
MSGLFARYMTAGLDGFREQGPIPLLGLLMSWTFDGVSSFPVQPVCHLSHRPCKLIALIPLLGSSYSVLYTVTLGM